MAKPSSTILLVDPQRSRRQALARLFTAAGLKPVQTGEMKAWLGSSKRAWPALIIVRAQSGSISELAWRRQLLKNSSAAAPRIWVMVPARGIGSARAALAPADLVSSIPEAPEQIVAQARSLLAGGAGSGNPPDARDRLLQMEVHDLKAPLANIVNLCELLLSGDLEADRRDEFIVSVSDNAKVMLKLVMNLLNVAALESGRMVLNRQSVQPIDVVQAAVAQIGWLLRRKRMSVRSIMPSDLPDLPADRELLVRLFVNLIDNAVHYGRANDEISVHAERNGKGVRFDVLDHGPGIPAGLRERIFDPYVQLEPGSGNSYSTGLGLTFCRLVAHAHGGRIWVEERSGGGSRFSVWFPA
jgi:signal transduction histidine kinase